MKVLLVPVRPSPIAVMTSARLRFVMVTEPVHMPFVKALVAVGLMVLDKSVKLLVPV